MNKPVAWMYKDEESGMVSFIKDKLPFDAVPLYTHPVKELTDEEILKVYDEYVMYPISRNGSICDFARMILRKAQEK